MTVNIGKMCFSLLFHSEFFLVKVLKKLKKKRVISFSATSPTLTVSGAILTLTGLNKLHTDMHTNQIQRNNDNKHVESLEAESKVRACVCGGGGVHVCVCAENTLFLCLTLGILYSFSPKPKRVYLCKFGPYTDQTLANPL